MKLIRSPHDPFVKKPIYIICGPKGPLRIICGVY